MIVLQLSHCRDAIELHEWALPAPVSRAHDDRDWTWEAVMLHDAQEAADYLGSKVSDDESIRKLRSFLASEELTDVSRLNDGQVLDAAATMVSNGRLIVYRKAPSVDDSKWRTHTVAGALPTGADAVTPSALRPRLPAEPTPPLAGLQADAPGDVDQDAQASTLRLAAVSGVPFCEMCERPKRNEAQASQERKAA